MKIILLPGLDGTGQLLQWFTPCLEGLNFQVEALPGGTLQDYPSLAETLRKCLPDEPLVLLAESFSCPLALKLAHTCPQVRGVIFVAGFLTSPGQKAIKWGTRLLLNQRLKNPLVRWAGRRWGFNGQVSTEVSDAIFDHLLNLDKTPLLARLQTLAQLQASGEKIHQPCLYIQPRQDRMVTNNNLADFARACSNLRVAPLDSSHFVLQTHPQQVAQLVRDFLLQLLPQSQLQ